MAGSTLAFGIEVEFLFKPSEALIRTRMREQWTAGLDHSLETQRAKNNRDVLRSAIAEELKSAGTAAGVSTQNYEAWSVMDEPTLDERKDFWRLELVSRCMTSNVDWQKEITTVFDTLGRIGEIKLTDGCSTHVHVSPSPGGDGYQAKQLHGITKAVAYFDDAITRVVPSTRKKNTWAESNFTQGKCASEILRLFQGISSHSWEPPFQRFDKIKSPTLIPLDMFNKKYVSWNFMHLSSQCGTVEFRRPPGVDNAKEAIHWVAFALGFIQSAMGFGWDRFEKEKKRGDVKNLAFFVTDGLKKLGPACGGIIDGIRSIKADASEPTQPTREEEEVIKAKQGAKLGKESNFAVKVASRPSTPGSASSSSRRSSSGSK